MRVKVGAPTEIGRRPRNPLAYAGRTECTVLLEQPESLDAELLHETEAEAEAVTGGCTARADHVRGVCFFVYSYSHSSYIDHGGVHFDRFSCPQSAPWPQVASSSFALRLGLSQENRRCALNGQQRKETKEKRPSPTPRLPTP